MLTSLLIANRGEIACRIIRTARAMGVRTIAVYSDADAGALHVRQADEAVHIGASPARESYLDGAKIIAAARASGAEAIHPGYGFLSENAEFAEAVIAAGLIWVGAPSAAIRAMGLKDAAKALMIAAGVPVTPGYLGEDQAPERLRAEADAIGYPVLIKAVAGGGGKGMRRVDTPADFADALGSCRREAASSFGDDRVLIEKYVLNPRHIEVQVFGDTHGNIVHLFERDCSLQRRHQKVIEEAPAPGMDDATRAAICAAAVTAARAVNYVGAGTIEFIADASEGLSADRIWFMEMNTRLQVEHPVTEEITGVDLVEWQLRVASGEPLPMRQDELAISGHAIEARLYAEDPARGFLPSIGKLIYFELPPSSSRIGSKSRIETGYSQGAEISLFYDPMISKLIAHAHTREEAIRRLGLDCSFVTAWPVKTNAEFLWRITEDERFRIGDVDTGMLSDRAEKIIPSGIPTPHALEALSDHILEPWLSAASPWQRKDAFRLNAEAGSVRHNFAFNGERISYDSGSATSDGRSVADVAEGYLVRDLGSTYVLTGWKESGIRHHYFHDGDILSPMPGKIIAVEVTEGEAVTKGQKLLTLEAMKMEQALTAPFDGQVAVLNAEPGGQVSEGAILARIERKDAA